MFVNVHLGKAFWSAHVLYFEQSFWTLNEDFLDWEHLKKIWQMSVTRQKESPSYPVMVLTEFNFFFKGKRHILINHHQSKYKFSAYIKCSLMLLKFDFLNFHSHVITLWCNCFNSCFQSCFLKKETTPWFHGFAVRHLTWLCLSQDATESDHVFQTS